MNAGTIICNGRPLSHFKNNTINHQYEHLSLNSLTKEQLFKSTINALRNNFSRDEVFEQNLINYLAENSSYRNYRKLQLLCESIIRTSYYFSHNQHNVLRPKDLCEDYYKILRETINFKKSFEENTHVLNEIYYDFALDHDYKILRKKVAENLSAKVTRQNQIYIEPFIDHLATGKQPENIDCLTIAKKIDFNFLEKIIADLTINSYQKITNQNIATDSKELSDIETKIINCAIKLKAYQARKEAVPLRIQKQMWNFISENNEEFDSKEFKLLFFQKLQNVEKILGIKFFLNDNVVFAKLSQNPTLQNLLDGGESFDVIKNFVDNSQNNNIQPLDLGGLVNHPHQTKIIEFLRQKQAFSKGRIKFHAAKTSLKVAIMKAICDKDFEFLENQRLFFDHNYGFGSYEENPPLKSSQVERWVQGCQNQAIQKKFAEVKLAPEEIRIEAQTNFISLLKQENPDAYRSLLSSCDNSLFTKWLTQKTKIPNFTAENLATIFKALTTHNNSQLKLEGEKKFLKLLNSKNQGEQHNVLIKLLKNNQNPVEIEKFLSAISTMQNKNILSQIYCTTATCTQENGFDIYANGFFLDAIQIDQNNKIAHEKLAKNYQQGIGCEPDAKEALKHYREIYRIEKIDEIKNHKQKTATKKFLENLKSLKDSLPKKDALRQEIKDRKLYAANAKKTLYNTNPNLKAIAEEQRFSISKVLGFGKSR